MVKLWTYIFCFLQTKIIVEKQWLESFDWKKFLEEVQVNRDNLESEFEDKYEHKGTSLQESNAGKCLSVVVWMHMSQLPQQDAQPQKRARKDNHAVNIKSKVNESAVKRPRQEGVKVEQITEEENVTGNSQQHLEIAAFKKESWSLKKLGEQVKVEHVELVDGFASKSDQIQRKEMIRVMKETLISTSKQFLYNDQYFQEDETKLKLWTLTVRETSKEVIACIVQTIFGQFCILAEVRLKPKEKIVTDEKQKSKLDFQNST